MSSLKGHAPICGGHAQLFEVEINHNNPQEFPSASQDGKWVGKSKFISHNLQALSISEILEIVDPETITCDMSTGRVRLLKPEEVTEMGQTCSVCRAEANKVKEQGKRTKTYSLCELRKHCTLESCWITCGKKIYDVTEYIKHHPGGVSSMLRYSGGRKDCTDDLFNFHSKQAVKIMTGFYIGRVSDCGVCQKKRKTMLRKMSVTIGDVCTIS